MKVDAMSNPLDVTARPEESLADAASRMRWNDVGCVVVLEDGRLIGILTERDLTRSVADNVDAARTTVEDYMTPDPHIVGVGTDAKEAARQMISAGVRHLPLVDALGALAGILSMRDIMADLLWCDDTALAVVFGEEAAS
ncbi:MAG: CBS domain-containing protein [Actinomycetota bacterium]